MCKNNRTKRDRLKDFINGIKEQALCANCGTKENLTFHHVDPTQKLATIHKIVQTYKSWARLSEEIKKCVLLCRDCHDKVHL